MLAGIAIPIERWREADAAVAQITNRFGLAETELHAAWLLRKYLEQSQIPDFDKLDWDQRRNQVARLRVAEIHRVRKFGVAKRNSQIKKVFRHTDPYVHLNLSERNRLAEEIAETIASWDWAVLFAACIDKSFFVTEHKPQHVNAQAFSKVVAQFTRFLEKAEQCGPVAARQREFGLLIHDNNATVALKHTRYIRAIQEFESALHGGIGSFERIIETPLFVDSSLTRMIQLADLWGYSLRRYVENGETRLFSILHGKKTVHGETPYLGPSNIHHFADPSCSCLICIRKVAEEG